MSFDAATLDRHGLTPDEYERIVELLGREPNLTELGMFSVMWSEHCSYKSSRVHLKTLPTTGPRVLQGPGENAGAVDIGDGLAAVFKIESHNHPSFIEPYQGAATGVGGIIRDIFTMGARPIALLNSLRFGPLDNAADAAHRRRRRRRHRRLRQQHRHPDRRRRGRVRRELRAAIRWSTCSASASRRTDEIIKGRAEGVGNPVYYVGAKTGRDGIHGATMASAEFDEASAEKRPAVQVGDPFMEKLLLEACLEVMKTDALRRHPGHGRGRPHVLDLRDARARRHRHRDRRRAGAAARDRHDAVRDHAVRIAGAHAARRRSRAARPRSSGIFEKWDLHAVQIGKVTDDGLVRVREHGVVVAEIPGDGADRRGAALRPADAPARRSRRGAASSIAPTLKPRPSLRDALLTLLAVADDRQQALDLPPVRPHGAHQHAGPAGHGRRGRAREGHRPRAGDVDRRQRPLLLARSEQGAKLAVAEAARNVACAGAVPIGVTEQPELRQPGAARDHVAVRRGGRGHRRGVPRVRDAGHRRQRQPLQRDRRPRDPADAGHRRRRAHRGRSEVRRTRVPGAGRT